MSLRKWRESLFSVYVGNLHPEVTEHELKSLFDKCGPVEDMVVLDSKNGQKDRLNRYGFVRFKEMEEAVRAIKELNGWPIKSQRIIVDMGHDTFTRMKKSEPIPDRQAVTTPKADDLLPIVSHIDGMKNIVRVKEACVRANSKAFSNSGVVKVSRITTKLERMPHSDIVITSRPIKPRLVIDKQDPLLDVYKKLSTRPSSSPESQDGNKSDDILESFSLLLDHKYVSPANQDILNTKEFVSSPTTPNANPLSEVSKADPLPSQLSPETDKVCNANDSTTHVTPAKHSTDSTPSSQKTFSSYVREGLQSSIRSSQLRDEPRADEKEHSMVHHSAFNKMNSSVAEKQEQTSAVSKCAANKELPSNMLKQDVLSNSKNFAPCDVSRLPKSLQNSRLARLTGKPYRPAACAGMRVPFLSPLNYSSGYSSEGTLSSLSS